MGIFWTNLITVAKRQESFVNPSWHRVCVISIWFGSCLMARPINLKTYSRAVIAIITMVTWSLVTVSGFLLWIAPSGPRSGHRLLFLSFTKREWGDLHL